MIISHSRRFIFIRTRSTGAEALQALLMPFLDAETDIASPVNGGPGLNWPADGAGGAAGAPVSLAMALEAFPEAVDYFKFTVERNPWDKCVSGYRRSLKEGSATASFPEFLRRGALPADWPRYTICGFPMVDLCLAFEDLERGIGELGRRLGLKPAWPPPGGARPGEEEEAQTRYRHYYDDALRDQVAARFRNEIAQFGYEF